jgi:hypothetical protein
MELDALVEAIDDLAAVDPSSLAGTDTIELLQRQLTRLAAVATTATAAFDASGSWAPSGSRTAAAWLSTRCRLPAGEARRQVRRGRALRHLPACRRAFADGDLSAAHVDVLVAQRRDSTMAALDRDEELLVGQARTLGYASFVRAVSYWAQLADPDGVEAEECRRRAGRDAYLAASFDGVWLGRITLDAVSGAVVAGELTRLERQLFEADWADARTALGRTPRVGELARTPGQRRADALVEMATRSRTAPADGRRPAPLFSVFVGYETLHGRICELAQGAAVTPGSLVPWLDEAVVERAVFGPGRRVEVSATARLFTGATRRGVELRNRGCTHPFCDGSTAGFEVDHVVPYADGGPTTQENGRILCGFHHRLRNQRPPPDGVR